MRSARVQRCEGWSVTDGMLRFSRAKAGRIHDPRAMPTHPNRPRSKRAARGATGETGIGPLDSKKCRTRRLGRRHSQALAAFLAAGREDLAAALGLHAGTKAV